MFEFTVSGMDCGSCARSLSNSLKTYDPAVEVSVDLRTQKVKVKSSLKQEEISNVISESGYPVLEAKAI